jgi:hypothetical protein
VLDTSDILNYDGLKFGVDTKIKNTTTDMYYKPTSLHPLVVELDENKKGLGEGKKLYLLSYT